MSMSLPPLSPHTPTSPSPSSRPPPSPRTPRPEITLTPPPSSSRNKKRRKSLRTALRSLFRSLPIFTPAAACRFPSVGAALASHPGRADGHIHGASRTTGTLFGHRKARITLAIQDSPGTVPLLLLELATPTGKFMQEMGSGEHIRIALECEKVAEHKKSTTTTTTERRRQLLEEPLWTAYVNGRKIGYAVRREPTEDDLTVMQLLHTVSVGAGVLPSDVVMDPATAGDGDLAYMRAHFDRVVGSRDSESFYMLNPDGTTGPELSIFFIRI
ncbi:protein MIZU-KUSSEI 1-like [Ananas comosus]|uniref:Protein MIZU-KUSSEI 1-like n=1 Tax=Ananas comosus TaxID=4615 RepID=A0A6P5H260_ANACO|nr:protein MIZU-KUSSEI 1-like [Ananas comosus]